MLDALDYPVGVVEREIMAIPSAFPWPVSNARRPFRRCASTAGLIVSVDTVEDAIADRQGRYREG